MIAIILFSALLSVIVTSGLYCIVPDPKQRKHRATVPAGNTVHRTIWTAQYTIGPHKP
jgi:hypothetical protein